MFEPGDRVTVKPNHDAWQRGDRSGTVQFVKSGRGAQRGDIFYHVLMDRSQMIRRCTDIQLELAAKRDPNKWLIQNIKESINA